jgi:hypothetical protein
MGRVGFIGQLYAKDELYAEIETLLFICECVNFGTRLEVLIFHSYSYYLYCIHMIMQKFGSILFYNLVLPK